MNHTICQRPDDDKRPREREQEYCALKLMAAGVHLSKSFRACRLDDGLARDLLSESAPDAHVARKDEHAIGDTV